jgi:hypothetical protein
VVRCDRFAWVINQRGDHTDLACRRSGGHDLHDPRPRQSGRKRTVSARFVHNDRLVDALSRQARPQSPPARERAPTTTPYAPVGHPAALLQPANRLVGILHGCLATGCCYDEETAWPRAGDKWCRLTTSPASRVGQTGVMWVEGFSRLWGNGYELGHRHVTACEDTVSWAATARPDCPQDR